MRLSAVVWAGVALGILALAAGGALAQDSTLQPPPLLVGIKDAPPFVLEAESDSPRGLSIDLIREVAARLDPPRQVEFRAYPDIPSHLAAVQRREVDLGIAATTITAEREQHLDFSLPFHWSGLGIVAQADAGSNLGSYLLSRGVLVPVLGVGVFVLACGCLIWVTERGSEVFDPRWQVGIPQAIWWTVVTMSTVGYGDYAPKRTLSRMLAVAVIFSGIALFGVVIAELTAAITVDEMRSQIRDPEDLRGKTVAVLAGSSGSEAAARKRARLLEVASVDDGLTALREGRAAAFVHDLPLLRYRLKDSDDSLVLVGSAFRRVDYGIVLPEGSALREPINRALLSLQEESEGAVYSRILEVWLGESVDP